MRQLILSERDIDTLGDLLDRLGGIDPHRVLLCPTPGTATAKDLIQLVDGVYKCFVELVDQTLVAKVFDRDGLGANTSLLPAVDEFIRRRRLGVVTGIRAPWRMKNGNVRLPNLSYMSMANYRRWSVRKPAIVPFGPDLAADIVARKNTPREMARKREDYFASGTRLVWEINPRRRTVTVYTGPTVSTRLTEADTLTGGDVLPGFALPLTELFADPLGDD